MEHFEAEVLRHDFTTAHGHHRRRVGLFTSLGDLHEALGIEAGDLLNRCIYEIIPRDKFEIKQQDLSLLSWTSEDADGGANRMIYNNLIGKNFGGTEYEVYLAESSEKLNVDIRPDLLALDRTECQMPELLDVARIGWLEELKKPFAVTPGIYWRENRRHLIFRVRIEDWHYILTDWESANLLGQEKIKPPGAIKIRHGNYLDMQKPIEQLPTKAAWRTTVFDYWLTQKLDEQPAAKLLNSETNL